MLTLFFQGLEARTTGATRVRRPWTARRPTPAWAARAVTTGEGLEDLGRSLAGAERAVVIAGSSISGLVLAARLGACARSHPGLQVVLVAGSPPVRRRLVAGCSLRFSTIRRMADALSVPEDELLDRFGGRAASFRRLAVARAEPGSRPPNLVRRMTLSAAELEAAGGPGSGDRGRVGPAGRARAGLGFAEIDPDETRAGAVVPVVRDKGTVTQLRLDDRNPVVDVHRSFTSGAPAINVDGMLAATVRAAAFAHAFTRSPASPPDAGREALLAADRAALSPVRWRNWATEWAFFRAPEPVRATAAHAPHLLWKAFVTDFARLRSTVPAPI